MSDEGAETQGESFTARLSLPRTLTLNLSVSLILTLFGIPPLPGLVLDRR